MADEFDANAELSNLLRNRPDKNSSFLQISKSSETGQSPDAMQSMLTVFQSAFPDMDFSIAEGAEGRKSVRGVSKPMPSGVSTAVPDGFNPKVMQAGILDLQAALERATDDQDKLDIAVKLQAAVNTQKAYNFTKYKAQAEAEFGVPDLVMAISQVQQAEAASPLNPRTGMPSGERMELLQALGTARVHAANRVNEMGNNDITLAGAENLAKATIIGIEKSLAVEGRKGIVADRDAKRDARNAAIIGMDPNYIQSISILKNGTPKPSEDQIRTIAGGIYDGKIKLTETEQIIAKASPDSLKGLYLAIKDPKHREQITQLLEAKEVAILGGDEKQAKIHMDLFKKVYGVDVTDFRTTGNKRLADQARKKASDNLVTHPDKKSREEASLNDRIGFQSDYLMQVVEQQFKGNITDWNGLIKGNDTARAVVTAMRINNPKNMNMSTFISDYLNYNDGKLLEEKSQTIQAIVASALAAYPPSVILPIPSEQSVQLQTQKMLASAYISAQTLHLNNPFSTP